MFQVPKNGVIFILIIALLTFLACSIDVSAGTAAGEVTADKGSHNFPPSLESYNDADFESITQILKHRIEKEPFNLVATIIFLCLALL